MKPRQDNIDRQLAKMEREPWYMVGAGLALAAMLAGFIWVIA